jgi:glutathione synthase/RimK-type ligase-like ATP-grasp enzyme
MSLIPCKKDSFIIPDKGEEFFLEWKHNLSHGSKPMILSKDSVSRMDEIHDIAINAARAVGIKFCSVDIVQDCEEKFLVLEINSGIMMDTFITAGKEQREIAKSIYKDAIIGSFMIR